MMLRRRFWLAALALVAALGCERPGVDQATVHPQPQPKAAGVTVYDFHADWCAACRRHRPHLTALEQRGVKIVHVAVENHPRLVERYGVKQLPTYVVLKDGQVIRKTGDIWLLIQILRRILPYLFGLL